MIGALLTLHIVAGAAGLLAGATALLVRKGAGLHRIAGSAFFLSMLVMAAAGLALAVLMPAAATLNSVVGLSTVYLVTTSWATIVQGERTSGRFEAGALVLGLCVGAGGLAAGLAAAESRDGMFDGMPAAAYLPFGAIALLGSALDVSVIARGGVAGAQRIARHLWRMSGALLIGAFAFFVGQADVFPDSVRRSGVLFVPPVAVAAVLLFWLLRVLLTGWAARPSATVRIALHAREAQGRRAG